MSFSKDFLWGAASASAQVEGAYLEDGKCLSIWDAAPAGKIKNNETCHDGCDHYHRFREDVALMKELGLKSYRFSVSWCRVMPEEGKINPKGLQFYSSIVDELLKNGIEPLVTLYHWDLPVWVQAKGGWMSEKIVPLFEAYVRAVVDALSDRVTYWMTINEPSCFIMNGHMQGVHAPFKHRYLALPRLTRNCLMANKAAFDCIRQHAKKAPKIGVALAASAFVPESDSAADIEAARSLTFEGNSGTMANRWFDDPILLGKPVSAYGVYRVPEKLAKAVKCDYDFLGVNVYSPLQKDWKDHSSEWPEGRKTSMGWLIDGRCLYWTLRFFHERYGLPMMVTENGMANDDAVAADGGVHDEKRVKFLSEYLGNVKRAVDEGIPVLGYQHWSVMDNFEWAEGYGPRFGLIHVDYETKKRTLKDSALWYRDVIGTNGETL